MLPTTTNAESHSNTITISITAKFPCKEGCSYGTNYINIYNHHNTKERYAAMEIKSDGGWNAYYLDNKRSFWAVAHHGSSAYGYNYALGSLEGHWKTEVWHGRFCLLIMTNLWVDFKSSPYCWYSTGVAWWGHWETAACSVCCSEFYWYMVYGCGFRNSYSQQD
jgi:hypothetical protein